MSVRMNDAQKKAARKANAMKMNVTKVKPVVVKHILDDQIISIYDIKVCLNSFSASIFYFNFLLLVTVGFVVILTALSFCISICRITCSTTQA